MSDITMCPGHNETGLCQKREKCYRFTAPVNTFRQSFFMQAPMDGCGSCEHFWPNDEWERNNVALGD